MQFLLVKGKRNVNVIGYVFMGFVLCIQTIWDIRYKKIPAVVSFTAGLIGICLCVIEKRDFVDVLFAMLPGVGCLVYAKISREAVGYGDGILLVVMSLYYSLEQLIIIGMAAFGTAGITGMMCLLFFQKRGDYEIPFVPFLLLGWSVERIVSLGGYE